jgi:hypothetical protein
MIARSYVYVFVHIKGSKTPGKKRKVKSDSVTDEVVSYYPVTSRYVLKNVHRTGGIARGGLSGSIRLKNSKIIGRSLVLPQATEKACM